MTYCKTLALQDYVRLEPVIAHILSVRDALVRDGAFARFEHEHRAWEYGVVSHALMTKGARKVLDVGGGASVFAPAYMTLMDSVVYQVDPGIEMQWLPKQEKALNIKLPYSLTDFREFLATHKEHSLEPFDAVVSISTIEHVPDDKTFFSDLLKLVKPGGLVAITFDFHPSGEQRLQGHLRTYNLESVVELIGMGWSNNFLTYGENGVHYDWHGPAVNDYTFGALVMEKRDE